VVVEEKRSADQVQIKEAILFDDRDGPSWQLPVLVLGHRRRLPLAPSPWPRGAVPDPRRALDPIMIAG